MLGIAAPGLMPDPHLVGKDDPLPGSGRPGVPLLVAARIERLVEGPHRVEDGAPGHQVRRRRIAKPGIALLLQAEYPVVDLGRCPALGSGHNHHPAGDARHRRIGREPAQPRHDPVRLRPAIGIGEVEDLAPRRRERGVARGIGSRLRLPDHPRIRRQAKVLRNLRGRIVAGHEDLEPLRVEVLRRQRVEASLQPRPIPEGGDDHRYVDRGTRVRHVPIRQSRTSSTPGAKAMKYGFS